jgi:hypothetical protein
LKIGTKKAKVFPDPVDAYMIILLQQQHLYESENEVLRLVGQPS